MTSPEPENVAKLVNWRIDRELEGRQPENPNFGHSWTERTPNIPGDEGRAAREIAEAMDERRDVLGERLTEDAPEWAVRHLGPVPEDLLDRAEWARRAGTVELYGIDAPNTAIGRVPAKLAVEQRAAWEAAHVSLGRTEDEHTLATASDAALREMVARYERETSWAPAHVGEELSEARQAEMRYEEKAILTQADADQAQDAEQRAELEAEARGYEDLVGTFNQRVEVLEQIDEARAAWCEETAPAREASEAARTELERRGLDEQAPDEQQGQTVEETAEAEQQLDKEAIVEYDPERLPELDWEVEGETYDQAPEVDEYQAVEVGRDELTYQEQEELDRALAAYEQQHRAPEQPSAEVEEGVEETVEQQLQPAGRNAQLDETLATYEQRLQAQAEADTTFEQQRAETEAPAIDWEVEGETYDQAPEVEEPQAIEEGVEAGQQQTAEQGQGVQQQAPGQDPEAQYRELYEQQYAQQLSAGTARGRGRHHGDAGRAGTGEPAQGRAETAAQQPLPAQLADLQEDLEKAHGALAEIASRREEREQSAQAEETVRAEQAEVARGREAEAPAQQIEREQSPIIQYGPPE
ncbi:hypothetical protein ABZV67_43565 [Streptomyces sp. NPDC005065]|uniref:hypothetical protein n=1 Tax=unclassified Streptomyces TaxID=2593676 RepID=UPI0033B7D74B